jgi:hypothetical protein
LPKVITSRLKIYEHTSELCRCRCRRRLGSRNNNPLSWYSLNTNGKSFPAYSASVSADPVSQRSRYHISVENLSVSKPALMSGLNCSTCQEAQWLRRSMRISTYSSLPCVRPVSFRRGRRRNLPPERKRQHGNHRHSRASLSASQEATHRVAARFAQTDRRSVFLSGTERTRLPVAAAIALRTAGAATAIVGSPTPPQNPPEGIRITSTFGISAMRIRL